jgi:hypothetical protein
MSKQYCVVCGIPTNKVCKKCGNPICFWHSCPDCEELEKSKPNNKWVGSMENNYDDCCTDYE